MTKEITNVGLAGDWHGNLSWAQQRLTDFHHLDITTILHVGDFGIWPGAAGKKYLNNLNTSLQGYQQKIYVTPGNHEDYNQIKQLQKINSGENKGWLQNPEQSNIFYAPRGHRWEWNNTSFVSLGGANSIDRDYPHRVENETWWAEEQIKPYEAQKVAKAGYADVFIAHDCPMQVPLEGGHKAGKAGKWSKEDRTYADKSRKVLQTAVDGVKPKLFVHGHYHMFVDMNVTMTAGSEEYVTRIFGLSKDGDFDNIAYLELPSLNVEIIDYVYDPWAELFR